MCVVTPPSARCYNARMPLAIAPSLIAGVLCLAALTAGCDSPANPTPPTPTPTSPDLGPLSLSSIEPTSGSTFGTIVATLVGTGFAAGTTVRIDGTLTPATVLPKAITFKMPAHAAGRVDVAVALPTGETKTLSQAYEYVHVDPPVITSIAPNVGSTAGDAPLEITGTGFQAGTTLALGGLLHDIDASSTSLFTYTKPSIAGIVDVVVTNPDGQFARIVGGFTYVPLDSLDFNGTWRGDAYASSGSRWPLEFTIQGNVLIGVSCGGSSDIVFSPSQEIGRGQFSFHGPAGTISGAILSPLISEGRINVPSCPNSTFWSATKTPSSR